MSIELTFDRYPATNGQGSSDRGATPLLIAHGLLGQKRNFTTLAKRFAEQRDVIVVDMRNHGDSPWDDRMDYGAMAEDLAAVIARETNGAAHVFGHSMGGKAAMRLALDAPDRVDCLIVGDIAPIAYTHSHASMVGAMRALHLASVTSRSDADKMLAEGVSDRATRAFLLQNLRMGGGEAAAWKPNLAVLSEAMAGLVGWEGLPGAVFHGPAFFLAGGASDYVQPAHQPVISAHFPNAQIEHLPGIGHWIHAHAPEAVFEKTERFIS